MLKPYRRHVLSCPHHAKGRAWEKCKCPIWVEGRLNGKRIRKSLDTANREFACGKILEMEAGKDELSLKGKECSVDEAVQDFLKNCRTRNLDPETIKKFEQVLTPLQSFCTARGISDVRSLDLDQLQEFVETLTKYEVLRGKKDAKEIVNKTSAAITREKKIERLRRFGAYCRKKGWADSVPAADIEKPVSRDKGVSPFTAEEWQAIRNAIDLYPQWNSFGYDNRARLRAFIYLLRYTALRISDVTQLKPSRIKDGRLMIRTAKTGAPINVPLPPDVLNALAVIQNGDAHYFWTGAGKLKSCVGDWQRSIRRLFKLAKVKGHPHMFRHMMAIELLENGVLVEHVAAILGNSPQIIYKHYAPWMPSRQKALDAAVKQVWGDAVPAPSPTNAPS